MLPNLTSRNRSNLHIYFVTHVGKTRAPDICPRRNPFICTYLTFRLASCGEASQWSVPNALLIALCRTPQGGRSCTPSCCRHNRPGDDPVRENVCACMRARGRFKQCQD
jgi:hypothetical protein